MEPVEEKISYEDRRLWIGNLDPRVTEYQLLKLVQKHGSIEKFDLIFHRSGPQAGQPKGYAFVTYSKSEEAIVAKTLLHNKLVGQKVVSVKWAHSINLEEIDKPKPEIVIPVLAMSKDDKKETDRLSQIQAIEAKLKLMEKKKEDELKINDTVATKPPIIVQYQYNNNTNTPLVTNNGYKYKSTSKKTDRFNKPYNKNKFHKR